jgi:chromosome segregation ATPase
MKKRLLTTINLSLFIGLVSLSPSLSYGVRPTILKQIEGVVGSSLTPAELAQVDGFYAQTGNNVHKTAHLILGQRQAQIAQQHATIQAAAQGQIQNLQGLLRNANDQIRSLAAANRRLADNANEAIRHSEELIRMLEQARANHERTTQRLQETQADLGRVRQKLLTSTVHAQREIEVLTIALGRERGENTQLRAAIGQLQAQLADSQRNYQEVEAALINIAKATLVWENGMTPAAAERAIIQSFQREIQITGKLQDLYLQTSRSIDSLLQEKYAKEQELLKALAESAQLKEQLRRQVFDLEGQEAQIEELRRKNNGLDRQVLNLSHTLEETRDEKVRLEKHVQQLTEDIYRIADRLGISRDQASNIVQSIFDKIDEYNRRFQEDAAALKDNEAHIERLGRELGLAVEQAGGAVRDHEQASRINEDLLGTISELRKKIATALKERDELVKRTEAAAAEAQRDMEDLRAGHKRELDRLRGEVAKAEQRASEDRADGEALAQELEEKRAKISDLKVRMAVLEDQIRAGVIQRSDEMRQIAQKSVDDFAQVRGMLESKIGVLKGALRYSSQATTPDSKLLPILEKMLANFESAIQNMHLVLQETPLNVPEQSRTAGSLRAFGRISPHSPRTPRRGAAEAAEAASPNIPGHPLGETRVRRGVGGEFRAAAPGTPKRTLPMFNPQDEEIYESDK